MKKQEFVGKTKEEALKIALETLNANEEEVVVIEKQVKKGLFSKKVEIEVITKEEINKSIKEYINFLVKGIGLEAKIETKNKENILMFNIVCPDPIIIGRNGRTLDAIQTLTHAMIGRELDNKYRCLIDANDYKQNKTAKLERLAKYTAKDVARNKIEVKLDPMNSYERRVIHNALSNSKDVITESVGQEPNRSVVIKPKN